MHILTPDKMPKPAISSAAGLPADVSIILVSSSKVNQVNRLFYLFMPLGAWKATAPNGHILPLVNRRNCRASRSPRAGPSPC